MGGEDSFVMMKLLEDAGVEYSALQWARTEYGKITHQHALMDLNYKYLTPKGIHRLSVYDDFTDGVFTSLYRPDIVGESALGNPCQVGTPEGAFESILICLAENISSIAFGNEKSADQGSLYSNDMELDINHQWMKSLEAEKSFADFIRSTLVSNINLFSILKPIHDTTIYRLFSRYPEMLPFVHSCNVEKPWCKKCAKCAYVWLNLMASFPVENVNDVFKTNLFDDPDLILSFRQLMGE